MTVSTARSPRLAAWCTTSVATRFTRWTGELLRRRLPPLLRPLDLRLLDLRLLDLRPLDLRREDPPLERLEELRRALLLRALEPLLLEDLRPLLRPAPPRRRELPPLFRPDDPDRERFLPLERLDFLAAAIAKLRVRRVRISRVARFAHNTPRHQRV